MVDVALLLALFLLLPVLELFAPVVMQWRTVAFFNPQPQEKQ